MSDRTLVLVLLSLRLAACDADDASTDGGTRIEYDVVDADIGGHAGGRRQDASMTAFDAAIHDIDSGITEAGLDAQSDAAGDAATAPDPDGDGGKDLPAPTCLTLASGDTHTTLDALDSRSPTWRRIDASGGCPAKQLTVVVVPFRLYTLCPAATARTIDVVMRGADMIETGGQDAVYDPLLAIYPSRTTMRDEPFACLAANDDGTFGAGLVSNSARIAGYVVAPDTEIVLVASSHQPAEQHGTGVYELSVSVQ